MWARLPALQRGSIETRTKIPYLFSPTNDWMIMWIVARHRREQVLSGDGLAATKACLSPVPAQYYQVEQADPRRRNKR